MSSVPGGRSLPSAMRSMSCLGRPKTFPNSRMTARYWKVLYAPTNATWGNRLKMYSVTSSRSVHEKSMSKSGGFVRYRLMNRSK